jgi:hypothetical protein
VPLGCKVSKLKEALEQSLAAHGFDSSQEGLLLGHITRNVSGRFVFLSPAWGAWLQEA